MAPGRQVPAVRHERPRRVTRGAGRSCATTSRPGRPGALTGFGYLYPAYSPDGQVRRGDPDLGVRDRRRHPRWGDGPGAAARHRRRRVVGADLVARRRRHRLPARRRPDRRPAPGQARRHAPSWTVERDDRPDRGLGPRAGVRAGLVHPGRPAARADAAARDAGRLGAPRRRARRRDRRYLERLAARSAATGTVLCLGLDPDPAGPAAGFAQRPRGRRALRRRWSSRRPCPYAAAVKPNLAFYEAFGSAGHRGAGAAARPDPGRRAGDRRRQARRHRVDRRPPGRGPVRRPGRGRRDRQPVPRRDRDRAAARARRPLRLRPVPDVQPGRRRAAGPARRGGSGAGAPAERAPRAGRAARRRLGPGRDGRSRRRGDRAGRARGDPRRRARVCRSSSPVSAPRAAPSTRSSPHGPATAERRRPDDPVAGLLVNVSRGIAGAASGRRRPARRPSERLAAAAADWAATTPCATLADREHPD